MDSLLDDDGGGGLGSATFRLLAAANGHRPMHAILITFLKLAFILGAAGASPIPPSRRGGIDVEDVEEEDDDGDDEDDEDDDDGDEDDDGDDGEDSF